MNNKQLHILLSTIMILGAMVPAVFAQSTTQHIRDSLRQTITLTEGSDQLNTYLRLAATYIPEGRDDLKRDTLFAIYDLVIAESKEQGTTHWGVALTNKFNTLMNRYEYDEVIRLVPASLDELAGNEVWKHYYPVYRTLLRAYENKGYREEALRHTTRMYEEAVKRGHDDGVGIALFQFSIMYDKMRRFDEAEKYLRQSIDKLSRVELLVWMEADARTRLCRTLLLQGRFDEAFTECAEHEKTNIRYEQASKSKQYSCWWNLWSIYAELYLKTGDLEKAEAYCDKLENTGRPIMLIMYRVRAKIYSQRGQYEQALEMAERTLELSHPDDLNEQREYLGLKSRILAAMNRGDEALSTFEAAAALNDSLRSLGFNEQLEEMRTRYETDREMAARKRNFTFFILTAIAFLLVLVGWIVHSRQMLRKNRNLYKRIKEQDRLQEILALSMTNGKNGPTLSAEPAGTDQQQQLVKQLHTYLLYEKNLANVDINRDEIITSLATNRSTLSEAVKGVTGKTLMEYIRSMQLEEARLILDKHPDLTIGAIATDCGFHSLTTFYRLFRKTYGISPSEYRKMAKLGD